MLAQNDRGRGDETAVNVKHKIEKRYQTAINEIQKNNDPDPLKITIFVTHEIDNGVYTHGRTRRRYRAVFTELLAAPAKHTV